MYDSVVPQGFYKPRIWYVSAIPCTCDTARILEIPWNSELMPRNIFLQASLLLDYTQGGKGVIWSSEGGGGGWNLRFKNPRAHNNWRHNCVCNFSPSALSGMMWLFLAGLRTSSFLNRYLIVLGARMYLEKTAVKAAPDFLQFQK